MSIALVSATGSPYELGLRHGQQQGPALRAFLDDGLCRLDRILPAPVDRDGLGALLGAYHVAIAAASPHLAAELDGLADGAGIDRSAAVLLQVRREILGYRRVPTMGDCTTYARAGAQPVLAQTVDLNGDLDDQLAVLRLGPAGSARRVLVLSFGGLLGYLGINSSGLAVGLIALSTLLSEILGWRPAPVAALASVDTSYAGYLLVAFFVLVGVTAALLWRRSAPHATSPPACEDLEG